MRNLLILLFALVMSHPVIAQAQSDVSVKLGKIESKVTENDATFFVNVEADGLTDGQKVDVYYYLQANGKDDGKKDDKNGKNPTADNPGKATLGDNGVYTFTLSDLEPNKDYTVVIFAGVGTDEFTKYDENSVKFKTEALKPEITITFTEKSSSVQDDNYAQIFVKLLVASTNLSVAPSLYYNLYLDEESEPIAKDVKLEQGGFNEYKATIPNLSFSSKYTVKVYATAADYDTGEVFYTSDFTSVEVTTPNDPNPNGEVSGVNSVETVGDVRYFDLQGNELKNLSKGRVYIKVEGNKAVKVVK